MLPCHQNNHETPHKSLQLQRSFMKWGTALDLKTQNRLNMKTPVVHRGLINFNYDLNTLIASLANIEIWGYPSSTIQFSFQETDMEGPKKYIHTSTHNIALFSIGVIYGRFESWTEDKSINYLSRCFVCWTVYKLFEVTLCVGLIRNYDRCFGFCPLTWAFFKTQGVGKWFCFWHLV